MANSVDPNRLLLFASILNLSGNVRQFFAADDYSRQQFQIYFFLGTLKVKIINIFLPISFNICFGSFEYPQHMLWLGFF